MNSFDLLGLQQAKLQCVRVPNANPMNSVGDLVNLINQQVVNPGSHDLTTTYTFNGAKVGQKKESFTVVALTQSTPNGAAANNGRPAPLAIATQTISLDEECNPVWNKVVDFGIKRRNTAPGRTILSIAKLDSGEVVQMNGFWAGQQTANNQFYTETSNDLLGNVIAGSGGTETTGGGGPAAHRWEFVVCKEQ